MQSIEATLLISSAFVGILTLFVLFFTGSIVAVLALWLVTALIVLVLWYYGFIDMNVLAPTTVTKKTEKTEEPKPATAPGLGGPKVGSEVFHINDDQFTYADAPAVCAAYGAELATLEQVTDAYNSGAEWCSYGWSAGGFALYPTQRGTWQSLQAEPDTVKRTACGRPGVNGGYFDPNTKFGVNCFGFKPKGKAELPLPPPGTDTVAFRAAVAKFAKQLATFTMTPFSRVEWSGYDSTLAGRYGSQFKAGDTARETFRERVVGTSGVDESVVENPVAAGSYTAAPYGLIGDRGPPGPIGLTGEASTVQGPAGVDGVDGQRGEQGDPGQTGQQGIQGVKGDKGDKGDTGAQGIPGTAGSTVGVVGQKGDPGVKGDKGDKGDQGIQGQEGKTGKDGVAGSAGAVGATGSTGAPGKDAKLMPRITHAWWGTNEKHNPIMEQTLSALKTGNPFTCNNATYGDVHRDRVKECNIGYQLAPGVNKIVRISEGQVFDPDVIPFTNSIAEEAAPVDPAVAQRQAAAKAAADAEADAEAEKGRLAEVMKKFFQNR